MNAQEKFDQLKTEFNLKDSDFYFLDLIPLICMIWADGDNQDPELQILYHFVIKHIAYLDKEAGIHVVSTDDATDFLDRFAHSKPSSRLLDELRSIAVDSDRKTFEAVKKTVFDYCLDIAAACVTQYPYDIRGRILDSEKELLITLFHEFNFVPEKETGAC